MVVVCAGASACLVPGAAPPPAGVYRQECHAPACPFQRPRPGRGAAPGTGRGRPGRAGRHRRAQQPPPPPQPCRPGLTRRHRPSAALARAPRGVQAKGGALANAATGAVLWSRGMNTERPMGSITKVMTAIVVLRAGDLHQRIKVPKGVIAYDRKYDASNAGLRPGDYLTARELLEALLLPSGCDAAYALAKAYGPGLTAFIAKMNATAQRNGPGPHPLLELRRAALAHRDVHLLHPARPDRAGPGGHAVPGVPLDRGPADLRPGRDPAAPRLRVADHEHAAHATTRARSGSRPGPPSRPGTACCSRPRENGHVLIGVVLHSSRNNDMAAFSDATKILDWGFRHV